jgi:hypothetical protein
MNHTKQRSGCNNFVGSCNNFSLPYHLLVRICHISVPLVWVISRAGTEGYILISRGPNIPLRSPYTVTLFASITPKIQ